MANQFSSLSLDSDPRQAQETNPGESQVGTAPNSREPSLPGGRSVLGDLSPTPHHSYGQGLPSFLSWNEQNEPNRTCPLPPRHFPR